MFLVLTGARATVPSWMPPRPSPLRSIRRYAPPPNPFSRLITLLTAHNFPVNHSPSPSSALLPHLLTLPFSSSSSPPSRPSRRRTLRTWAAAPWAPMTWAGARTAPPPGSPKSSVTSRAWWRSRAATARCGTCPPRSHRYEPHDHERTSAKDKPLPAPANRFLHRLSPLNKNS